MRIHGRRKVAGSVALLLLVVLAAAAGSLAGLMLVYSVDLPQIADLERYRPLTTTDLYDVHGRSSAPSPWSGACVVHYDDFPPILRQAVISIEDKNFESHWGVNVFRVLGAAYHDLTSSGRAQGASTLTMQLARNLFLSPNAPSGGSCRKSFSPSRSSTALPSSRFLRSTPTRFISATGVYGFEAGSEYYFSKHANDLTLPEAALLAGLPKGPVAYSPILNPDRAFRRRNMVINAMLEDGVITAAQANAAKASAAGPAHGAAAQQRRAVVRGGGAARAGAAVRRGEGARGGAAGVHDAGSGLCSRRRIAPCWMGWPRYERRHGWTGHLLNVIAAGESTGRASGIRTGVCRSRRERMCMGW